jgi:glutamyl/glutaminyl-tRNA synthetase
MVLGPDHTKLSKRHGATSVDEFREKGYLPEALLNYLALLSWSPGENEEILPLAEMARRFRLSDVGHSASVFDEEKLAWVNRHYLKDARPDRLAALAIPYLERAGYARPPVAADAVSFLASIAPVFSSSVDRLDQVPERLRQLFHFSAADALARPELRAEVGAPDARRVIEAAADELDRSPRLHDKEAFRAFANRVRQQTSQKGRALFHPIRIAVTGESDGPELDLLVPAIDRGADLNENAGLASMTGCRERVRAFMVSLKS